MSKNRKDCITSTHYFGLDRWKETNTQYTRDDIRAKYYELRPQYPIVREYNGENNVKLLKHIRDELLPEVDIKLHGVVKWNRQEILRAQMCNEIRCIFDEEKPSEIGRMLREGKFSTKVHRMVDGKLVTIETQPDRVAAETGTKMSKLKIDTNCNF